jgi:hypothetical protein
MNPQSGNDELNSLGYASSAPDFSGLAPATSTKPQDEADLPALLLLSRLLANRRAYYSSVDSLSYGEDLTVENQLIINKKVVFHIQELENIVTSTVQKVKEKLNDERQ